MQNHYPRRHAFHCFEFMRTEEDRLAARRQFLNQTPQDQARPHIEARERLVEQDQFGIVQESRRQQHLLPHALRIRRNWCVPVAMQGEQAQEPVDLILGRFGGQSPQLPHHHQVFESAQMPVQMRLLRHISHTLLPCDQVALNRNAFEQDLARRYLQQPGDHLHGCLLYTSRCV